MPVLEVRRRDPQATRGAILDAAERLFVEKGFAATSMTEVAQEAAVTKSLIHHHFGSKEELWNEVKKKEVSHYAELYQALLEEGPDKEGEMVVRSVDSYFRFLKQHPEYVRLSGWMSLEDPKLAGFVRPELVRMSTDLLRELQTQGVLRQDIDANHVFIMVVGLCMHWFMARSTYRSAQLVDADPELADEAYLKDLLKLFFDGVRSRA